MPYQYQLRAVKTHDIETLFPLLLKLPSPFEFHLLEMMKTPPRHGFKTVGDLIKRPDPPQGWAYWTPLAVLMVFRQASPVVFFSPLVAPVKAADFDSVGKEGVIFETEPTELALLQLALGRYLAYLIRKIEADSQALKEMRDQQLELIQTIREQAPGVIKPSLETLQRWYDA